MGGRGTRPVITLDRGLVEEGLGAGGTGIWNSSESELRSMRPGSLVESTEVLSTIDSRVDCALERASLDTLKILGGGWIAVEEFGFAECISLVG